MNINKHVLRKTENLPVIIFQLVEKKHSNQTGQLAKIYKCGGLIRETENAIYKIIPLPIIPMRISVLSKIDLLKIKTPTSGDEQDWICMIEHTDNGTTIPGKAQIYGKTPIPPEIKKVFAW